MQQRILRYNVGGNFAYNMGYILDGEYVSPRLEGRRTYAVIGDMWPENFGNVNASQSMQLHGENGANVLFEDGRIQLIKVCNVDRSRMIDNPFLNRNCRQAVGIDRDDSCLGPSYWLPFADCEEFAP